MTKKTTAIVVNDSYVAEVVPDLTGFEELDHLPDGLPKGDDWHTRTLSGYCPVQGEGWVEGFHWYFRARGTHWAMTVAMNLDVDHALDGPAWRHAEDYHPDDPFSAGWMPLAEAAGFIRKAIEIWQSPEERESRDKWFAGLSSNKIR